MKVYHCDRCKKEIRSTINELYIDWHVIRNVKIKHLCRNCRKEFKEWLKCT